MIGQTDGAQINEHGDLIPTRTAVKVERRYALVVTSHRGDLYLPETLAIARDMLPWDRIEWKVLVDDGSAAGYQPGFHRHFTRERAGLSASVTSGWSLSMMPPPGSVGVDYVFHLEEDFHLLEPVDLDGMADVIERDGLAQMCLLRQPALTPEEQLAGGFLNIHPEAYEQRPEYLFHRRCFSLNPCLIPAHVISEGWPHGNEAEQTARWEDAGFGIWGQRGDDPRCLHVGLEGGMGTPGWTP